MILDKLIRDAALAEELIPIDELEEFAERRRMEKKNWDPITIQDAKGIHKSDGGALKVRVDGKDYWIPEKLISEDSEVYGVDHEGDLVIPTWFAEEKGLA